MSDKRNDGRVRWNFSAMLVGIDPCQNRARHAPS